MMSWNLILRLVVAGLLGGAIGMERAFRSKEAGVRTHFIVALGSALFMVISQFAFTGRFDAARVAAQVVSGIGFIGAGVIIFQKNAVRGVTTAAGLWVAAGIGLACGAGMFDLAAAAAVLTVICLEAMHFVTKRHGERAVEVKVRPVSGGEVGAILEKLQGLGIDVESFSISEETARFQFRLKNKDYLSTVQSILGFTKEYNIEII